MYPFSDKRLKHVSGLVKPIKLELSGSQINLVSRPTFKKFSFPSGIKRPMSASSLIMDYQNHGGSGLIMRRGSPSWSRPQSADNMCSSSRRIGRSGKLAAKFSSLDQNYNHRSDNDLENDEDYFFIDDDRFSGSGSFSNLVAAHTASSSKLIQNMMGSLSSDDAFESSHTDSSKKLSSASSFPVLSDDTSDREIMKKQLMASVGVSTISSDSPTAVGSTASTVACALSVSVGSAVDSSNVITTSVPTSGVKNSCVIATNVKRSSGLSKGRLDVFNCDKFGSDLRSKIDGSSSTEGRVTFDMDRSNVFVSEIESDDSRMTKSSSLINNLEPGLVSKPPLPPTLDSSRRLTPNSSYMLSYNLDNNNIADNNNVGYYDEDEIINLKFQRWFPNSVVNRTDDNTNDEGNRIEEDCSDDQKETHHSDNDMSSPDSFPCLPVSDNSNKSSASGDRNVVSKYVSDAYDDLIRRYECSTNKEKIKLIHDHLINTRPNINNFRDQESFVSADSDGDDVKKFTEKQIKPRQASSSISVTDNGDLSNDSCDVDKNALGDMDNKDKITKDCLKNKKNKVTLKTRDQRSRPNRQSVRKLMMSAAHVVSIKSDNQNNKTVDDKSGNGRGQKDFTNNSRIPKAVVIENKSGGNYDLYNAINTERLIRDEINFSRRTMNLINDATIVSDGNQTVNNCTETSFQSSLQPNDVESIRFSTDFLENCNRGKLLAYETTGIGVNDKMLNDFLSDTDKSVACVDNIDRNLARLPNDRDDKCDKQEINKSKETSALPIITVTDESENLIKEVNMSLASSDFANNDNSVADCNKLLCPITDKLVLPSTEYNNKNYFYNSIMRSNDVGNNNSSNDFQEENCDGVIKKFIKARLAVSSEYIIETIGPKSSCNRLAAQSSKGVSVKDSNCTEMLPSNQSVASLGLKDFQSDSIDCSQSSEAKKNLPVDVTKDTQLLNDVENTIPERDTANYQGDKNEVVIQSRKAKALFCSENGKYFNNCDGESSTYDDIVDILKVLEREEQGDCSFMKSHDDRAAGVVQYESRGTVDEPKIVTSNLNRNASSNYSEGWSESYNINRVGTGVDDNLTRMAILNYLDESDRKSEEALKIKTASPNNPDVCKNYPVSISPSSVSSVPISKANRNRTFERTNMKTPESDCKESSLADLLTLSAPELAQRVMVLTTHLEQKITELNAADDQLNEMRRSFDSYKNDNETAVIRHQTFIDQLLAEKKQLADQCSAIIKEMDAKHSNAIKVLEERHKVELKSVCDKTAAAEKFKRERWIDTKTKKIKELTVKGLEPELNRMAAVHQEELNELRRAHQRQLEEAEAAFNRRLAAARTQADADREQAVLREREASRNRLEQEIVELEKSYQEQRRKLLAEVRAERDQIQKENCRILAEKECSLQSKLEKICQEAQEKQEQLEKGYQAELDRMKSVLEAEKNAWISRQKVEWIEKEKAFREECKRERDKDIDLAIRKLETEASAREQLVQNKLRREKERYDGEVKEMENIQKELRQKLKEMRDDINRAEEKNAQLCCQLNKVQTEYDIFKQTVENQMNEKDKMVESAQNDAKRQLITVKQEMARARIEFDTQINNITGEKEREFQRVFARVKEVVSKKDETISLVEKQRDAALDRCSQLEKMLTQQRHQQEDHIATRYRQDKFNSSLNHRKK